MRCHHGATGGRVGPIATVAPTVVGRHAPAWSGAGLLITGAASGLALVVLLWDRETSGDLRAAMALLVCTLVPYGIAGSVLIRERPDLPFGWLLLGSGLAMAVGVWAVYIACRSGIPGDFGPVATWTFSLGTLMILPLGVQGLINVRFPSGRPSSRKARVLEILIAAALVLAVMGGLLGSQAIQGALPGTTPGERNPLTGGTPVEAAADSTLVLVPVLVLLGLVAGLGVVVRFWRATGVERQQLKWRAAGVCAALLLFPLAVTDRLSPVVDYVDPTLFVATLAFPVLRYRLWAIDTIIHRSVMYGMVTAALLVGYGAVVVVGSSIVSERVASWAAALGVALAFLPVRTAAQRLADRIFFGDRADPYRVMADVAGRLNSATTPGETLSGVVNSVAASLRLPHVAIERPDAAVIAASGPRPDGALVERWDLAYQGQQVGRLAAVPRRGESQLSERDRALLADVARQAGAAVRAEALTADLVRSRQRLVTAREEERRRLRRDLHDGLGPLLTGLALNLDAARTGLASARGDSEGWRADLDRVEAQLGRAAEASAQAIDDLRGLVHGLRPPALDDLGLVGAIRQQAERIAAGAGTVVTVAADPGVVELPAAVEVAAFRAAVEGITNAVRHGRAGHVTVSIRFPAQGQLEVSVEDDAPPGQAWEPGVGLQGIRERAEEIGGILKAGPTRTGGRLIVRYQLPDRPAVGAPAQDGPATSATPPAPSLARPPEARTHPTGSTARPPADPAMDAARIGAHRSSAAVDATQTEGPG